MNYILSKRLKLAVFAAVASILSGACSSQNFAQPPDAVVYGQKYTYNKQVDVLFLIDTKSAMSSSQQALGAQMPAFLEALDKTGLDYQIAVTTMDMSSSGEKGRFIGSPAILTRETSNLASILSHRMYIGDYDWKPMTRGIEAAKTGLTGLNATSGPNAGFLRPNAMLALVFLSNRDDRSTPEDFVAFFDGLRPPLPYGDRSWVAQFMGVMPNDPTCVTRPDWQYAEPGLGFIELAKASGGVSESICDGDVRRALTSVKARVLEKLTVFKLTGKPVIASIKVSINGVAVPKDAVNGWTYDEASNTVRMHGTAIPDASGVITIDFDRIGLS